MERLTTCAAAPPPAPIESSAEAALRCNAAAEIPLKDVDHTPLNGACAAAIPSTGNSPDGWRGIGRCCLFALVAVAFALQGCVAVKEGDRETVDQTKKGGQEVQADGKKVEGAGVELQGSSDPAAAAKGKELEATGKKLQQTGKDIELNSGQTQELVGMPKPENQKPYSSKNSEDARTKAAEQHANPWWKVAGTWIIGLVCGTGGIAVLQRFFPGFFAGPLGIAASALMEGIARVRAVAAARDDGKVHMDEVLAELKRVQENEGVQAVVKDYAHRIEKKIFGKTLGDEEPPVTASKGGTPPE